MKAILRALLPYIIGAGLLALVIAGIWWYGESQREAGRQECEAAHNLADLESFKQEATKLSGISSQLETGLEALRDAEPKVIERYTRVEVQAPLPAGCVRDAFRVRETNAAIREANTSRKSIGAVP